MAFLIATALGCGHSGAPSEPPSADITPGQQWLSWTPKEQANFVAGYIDGYSEGTETACLSADKLFETSKPHHPGYDSVASTILSSRCRASVEGYSSGSNRSLNVYATILTSFYRENPKYRSMPYSYLMEYLKGSGTKTAAQLEAMAEKGELRTTFY